MKNAKIAKLLKGAYSIKLKETSDSSATLNVAWLDVHGKMNETQVKIKAGKTIEF
ncbi:hypothetical protein [Nitrosopumilus sp. b1]|uniref:hypothetical protein n=1 Tax=Nitrosopumilus sp. b1 TaxID=2109907 RepID=UPI0015F54247|nr:hypothetical protein [Nitrosopumilus sp. b1]